MKICIPTAGTKGLDETVFGHFGSAPYFTIYDTETKSVAVVTNGNQHHSHGSCQPAKALEGQDVDVVVCGGMGNGAVSKLNKMNIKAYKVDAPTVKEAVLRFERGEIVPLTSQNACQMHDCH